jgi:hypothetical protein
LYKIISSFESKFVEVLKEKFIIFSVITLLLNFIVITQKFSFIPTSNITFWEGVNRKSGIFIDPNAFGIVSFIYVWGIFEFIKNYLLKTSLILFFIFAGIYSGSRTFLLTLFIFALVYYLGKVVSKASKKYLLMLTLIAVCSIILINSFNLSELTFINFLPIGLQRVIATLHYETFFTQISSRIIFWRIAIENFLLNPFFGIGFNQFEQSVTPVSKSLGFELNGWTDNANNFYLGLLSEIGLVGVLSISIFFILNKIVSRANIVFLFPGFIAILISLLFGPHFDFFEVGVLFAIVFGLSSNFTLKSQFSFKKANKITFFILAILTLLIVPIAHARYSKKDFGFFTRNGKYFLRTDAKLTFMCNKNIEGVLFIPEKEINKSEISLHIPFLIREKLTINKDSPFPIVVPCIDNKAVIFINDCSPILIPSTSESKKGIRPYCVAFELKSY